MIEFMKVNQKRMNILRFMQLKTAENHLISFYRDFSPNLILDLRLDQPLGKKETIHLQTIATEQRNNFNELVSTLSRPYIDQLDWWVEGPASRNTFSSPFFHYFCRIHLINHLLNQYSFEYKILLVDSLALKDILEKLLSLNHKSDCKVLYVVPLSIRLKEMVKKSIQLPIFFLMKFFQMLVVRLTKSSQKKILNLHQPIVLIDTFVLSEYATDDRWYGNFWTLLTKDLQDNIYFAPSVILRPVKNLYSTYKQLRSSSRNNLIKEDYLKWTDFWFAFTHHKRIRMFDIKPVEICHLDISPLVKEELSSNKDLLTTIESLLTYRFIMRLKNSGVNIRLAIDWFEGQVIDKAWNLALKTFYPQVKRLGYQVVISHPFYLSSYPIEIERQANVIPDIMTVQGKGRIPIIQEFLNDLEVVAIPAIRTPHIWKYDFDSENIKSNNFTIVLTLPISDSIAVQILDQLILVDSLIKDKQRIIQYIIKRHPAGGSSEQIKKQLGKCIPDKFIFTNEKSLSLLLKEANLLVTVASSSCLDALAWGIPVIIIENENGLSHNTIPSGVPEDMYKSVRGLAQLQSAILEFVCADEEVLVQQKERGKEIRELFFEPITLEGVYNFLLI